MTEVEYNTIMNYCYKMADSENNKSINAILYMEADTALKYGHGEYCYYNIAQFITDLYEKGEIANGGKENS